MKQFSLHSARRRARLYATGVVACAVVGTMALAASGPADAASVSTPGVTSTSITLGATEPLTGVAANYNDIAPAMQAVFSWANAHGGVNGRKINFKFLDDQYTPSITSTLTHQLVLQDNIFADVGSLGTPTQLQVQPYLNGLKVPQLFILSGCNCWSSSKYPYSSGYQPPYTVDGKILGSYVAKNFSGEKVGYFTQDDEFGFDTIKGLNMEIKGSSVVSKQTYVASTAAYVAGLNSQVAALQASGAKVVVLAAIPPFVGLFATTAATLGYTPQLVIDGVAGDPSAIGAPAALTTPAPNGQALLNGAITDGYGAFENQTSNPWVQVATKLLTKYDSEVAKNGITGDELVGFNLGYTIYQALKAGGEEPDSPKPAEPRSRPTARTSPNLASCPTPTRRPSTSVTRASSCTRCRPRPRRSRSRRGRSWASLRSAPCTTRAPAPARSRSGTVHRTRFRRASRTPPEPKRNEPPESTGGGR